MRRIFLLSIALLFGLIISVMGVRQVQAQIDAFTFFIPYPADLTDDQYSLGKGGDPTYLNGNVVTTISIAVTQADTLIYYDHWEDGLEDNLTSPTQNTTEIWGDGDLSNGIAPGFPGDVLNAGDAISIQNPIPLPRDPADFFFDGGDKLTAVRGNIAISVANWIENPGGIFYAGSWELYPTGSWGTDYISPIGEDLGGVRAGFSVVLVNVQAVQDNTTVDLDLDADGTFENTIVLNEGEQFTQVSGTTNSGGLIQASGPVQVHLFSSDPPTDWEARAYSLLPSSQWTNDYVAPRASAGDFWLYNPDPVNTITVTATTSIAADFPIVIPPRTTAQYVPPGATGVQFLSNDGDFYGVAALDPGGARDWGYALIPTANLTTQKLVGWAPGNNANPPNAFFSRVYLTALVTTTVRADFDNDGTPDFDYVIDPLVEVPVIDDPDFDLTGAYFYTEDGTPFVAVWGQDPSAPGGGTAIDVGTAIVPLPALALQKSLTLVNDADGTGSPTWGDTIRFEIFVANNSRTILNPVTITDSPPPSTTYVPNTTTVGGVPVPDGTGGTTFPLETGYDEVLGALGSITATFDVIINADVDRVENSASAESPGVPPVTGTVGVPIKVAAFELDKRLIDPANGQANRGDVITYGITITSTGNISITKLPLRDSFDEAQLTFISANPTQSITASGVITWTDLATTTVFGPLNPDDVISVTVTAGVDNVPADTTTLSNTAGVEGAKGADGSPLPTITDTTTVTVPRLAASYEFDKQLISPATGQSGPGETTVFGLTITNTGNLSITTLTLTDSYDPAHLTFVSSEPAPDSNQPGQTVWSSLVDPANPFLPGATLPLTVSYSVVDPLPAGVPNTTNSAGVDGVEDSLGNTLTPTTATAVVNFQPPTPTFTPTPSPTPSPTATPSGGGDSGSGGDDDDDDDDTPPATPPPAVPSPTATGQPDEVASAFAPPPGGSGDAAAPGGEQPALPVTLLPETGVIEGPSGWLPVISLALVILAGFGVWVRKRILSK